MNRTILLLISIFVIPTVIAADTNYGLKFNSYEVLGKDRTGLMLESNESVKSNENLSLNFDLQIRNETLFGSIVRIISESGNSIILSLGTNEKGEPIPVLLINNKITHIKDKIIFKKWFTVNILISNTDHTIVLKYNNFTQTFQNQKNKWDNIKICFGASSISHFFTEEVPPISIKDVKLVRGNKLFRHWVLGKHIDSICYDEIAQIKAIAYKPVWLIDKYTQWEKKLSLSFNNSNSTQYTFDAKNNTVYIVPNEKEIISYNPETNSKKIILVNGGLPASKSTNQLIFDSQKQQLISYNLEEQYISTFSFNTNSWSNNRTSTQETRFWHHTADFWPTKASIITFGGYGMYQYKNDLFNISTNSNLWETRKVNSIPKRYSAASLIVNDTLFIFSGEGNQLGKQELPSQIYNDLYAIDLKSYKVTLLWKSASNDIGLPCGNMIYSPTEKCFYVLTSKDGGSLFKISKRSPSIELLMSNKNQKLEADFNFHTLMKPENVNKIYALYCRDYKSGNSKIDIYETSYPPLSSKSTLQTPPSQANYIYLILLGIIILISLFVFARIKNSKKISLKKSLVTPLETEIIDEYITEEIQTKNQHFNRSIKSISLLGGFNVRDRDGNDITNQFAPVLKTIILSVILNGQEGKGVNSTMIDSLLWPDKDKKSTRNNRNVSINRLNNVLENVGAIRIYSDNNFWRIEVSDDTFCDYFAIGKLMKLSEKEILNDKELTLQLLELLSFGQLLPFTQSEWIDTYKALYSNFSLDILSSLLEKEEVKNNVRMKLKIAEIISLFDSINENALNIKCNLLYALGKKGLAKFTYDNFCKEYESLLGEKYHVPFMKLIEVSNNLNPK